MSIDFIFSILILIFSIVVHEVSHGYSAYLLGDNTAKYQGRLTLNPIKHLELFGSIILPTVSYLFGGFIIGWAKPIPFNPYNIKNRWGEAIIAFAGPLSNICIALFFGILLRFLPLSFFVTSGVGHMFVLIVLTNLVLAVFNLVPIPPLDGSKIIFSLFPNKLNDLRQKIEIYGTTLLIFFIFFLWQYLLPLVGFFFRLITGITPGM